MDAHIMLWLVVTIFNLATIFLLKFVLSGVNVNAMVQEKSVDPPQPGVQSKDNTSYSRVAGLIGSIIIATFFWSIGNVVIFKSFSNVGEVGSFVKDIWPYLLSGSALFAPYAFNQLSSIFK